MTTNTNTREVFEIDWDLQEREEIELGREVPEIPYVSPRSLRKKNRLEFSPYEISKHRTLERERAEGLLTHILERKAKVSKVFIYDSRYDLISIHCTPVVFLERENGRVFISKIQIPEKQDTFPKLLNLTRLLLRRLGFKAVRSGDFTVVETQGTLKVLAEGESWKVGLYNTPEFLKGKEPELKPWVQLPLIPEEL